MNNGNQPTPSVVPPAQYTTPAMPVPPQPINPQSFGRVEHTASKKSNINTGLIKTISLVLTSLLAAVFVVLFVWMYVQWNEASTDVESQVNKAVAQAEYDLRKDLETQFAEREKYPLKTFAGPTDFGSLTFEYPKTWSLYIPDDAARAGDYHAYFNPDHVNRVEDETVMALRVSILNELMDEVLEDYNDKVEDKEMTHSSKVVNGVNVDIYTGLLDSDLKGIVCIFKIRDKTAVLQTDSDIVFKEDFYKILETIRYKA